MNRRQAVQRVSLLLGGSVLGAELFLKGCKSTDKNKSAASGEQQFYDELMAQYKSDQSFFSPDEIAFLDEVAETILPKTSTPGAKDAKVGEFMNVMVRDCYTPENQQIFKGGISKINQLSQEKYKADFLKIQPTQRTELLVALDNEQKEYHKAKKPDEPTHYFRMMRELTLLGFFTSEPGATKVLRYVAIPAKYDPCMPYQKGDRAWAT